MREMKDSGIEWIGEIPVDWSILPVKRFFRNEKRIVGSDVDKYERLALTMNGVIKRSKDDSEGLQPEKFESYQILRKNELVFKLIDLENVKTSRVGLSPYTGLVSPAYIVITNDKEDNRFYYYWFMFMYYNEVFNHLGGEGVRSALNAKDVLSLPVPAISVELMKRIADYLDTKCNKIDSIIELQQEVIEKLKKYRYSVISEKVSPINAYTIKLKKVLKNIEQGWSPSPTERRDENGWKVLSLAAIKSGEFIGNNSKPFNGTHDKCNALALRENDFLLTRSNTKELVGQVCIVRNVETNTIFSDLIYRLTFNNSFMLNRFAVYYFQSAFMRQQIQRDAHGSSSTMAKITHKDIENWDISIPSIKEQHQIADYLDKKCYSIDSAIEKKQAIIEKLKEYKKSLIYEVVTGKREV